MQLVRTVTLVCLGSVACGFPSANVHVAELHGDTVDVPEAFRTYSAALGSSGQGRVFVNFDGARIAFGGSNSRLGTSFIVPQDGGAAFPPFDGAQYGPDRAAVVAGIVAEVQRDFAPWDVVVTSEPPDGGAWTMVVVGGTPDLIGRPPYTAGIAPVDLGNPNPRDVAFVFSGILYSEKAVANCISHELGHTFGLWHLEAQDDLMFPWLFEAPGNWQAGTIYGTALAQDEPQIFNGLFGSTVDAGTPDAGTPDGG